MSELVVAVILVATGFLFSLEIRRRRLAEMRLQETLASVEGQVEERTKALSAAMAELEKATQLRDQFLATASHELRTPLNAIVGWSHVLTSGAAKTEEEIRQAVSAIERNARIQTRLIEDLLDVSRMSQGALSLRTAPMDLRAVVDAAIDTVRPTAVAKNITIATDDERRALPVVGDEQRLQQVIWNLLSNSVKYSPSGGVISVSAREDAGCAVVVISDTGEGIDPSFLPLVFEPFCQAPAKTMRSGLGLGLAIVRQLVDLHGGRLTAASAGVGQGAQFTVALPLAKGEDATVSAA